MHEVLQSFIPKSKRLEECYQFLDKQPGADSAENAVSLLIETFSVVESMYNIPSLKRMEIPGFAHWKENKQFKVYILERRLHVVFAGYEGSLMIMNHYGHCPYKFPGFYKKRKDDLIEYGKTNINGLSLW